MSNDADTGTDNESVLPVHTEECICKNCVEECIGELLMGLAERHK